MKKTYIVIIVLVLVVLGVFYFAGKGGKLEAPVLNKVETAPIVNEADVKEFTVSGQNFSFTPSSITVQKGDKVRITFKSTQGFHDFRIDEYGVATKQLQSPGEEILEFTADKTGNFEYYCSVGSHRSMGMVGVLKVE